MRLRICALVVAVGLSTMTWAQSGSTGFNLNGIGPSKGEVIGAAVGVAAAVVVVVVVLVKVHQKQVEGCVAPSDQGLHLTNDQDHQTYTLAAGGMNLQAGRRVKLKGKIHKKSRGMREFEVRRVVKDEGACSPPAPAS